MSRSATRAVLRTVAAVLSAAALASTVGGCSQAYLDQHDAIAPSLGDAIAANQAVQVIDPWPPRSGSTNLVFNGQRMQAAAERYRTNAVVPPVDPMAPQVAAPAAPTSSNGNNGSSSSGSPNATFLIGAPAAAAAATP